MLSLPVVSQPERLAPKLAGLLHGQGIPLTSGSASKVQDGIKATGHPPFPSASDYGLFHAFTNGPAIDGRLATTNQHIGTPGSHPRRVRFACRDPSGVHGPRMRIMDFERRLSLARFGCLASVNIGRRCPCRSRQHQSGGEPATITTKAPHLPCVLVTCAAAHGGSRQSSTPRSESFTRLGDREASA